MVIPDAGHRAVMRLSDRNIRCDPVGILTELRARVHIIAVIVAVVRVLLKVTQDLKDLLIAERGDPVDPLQAAARDVSSHIEFHHGCRVGVELEKNGPVFEDLPDARHHRVAHLLLVKGPEH